MSEWFDPPVVALVVVLSALLAVLAYRRQRNSPVWFGVGIAAFLIGSAIVNTLLPATTLEPDSEPGAAYTLWQDPALRSDFGLVLLLAALAVILALVIRWLVRAADTPRPAGVWSAIASALVLVFPVIVWVWCAAWLATVGNYTDILLPALAFTAITVVTGLLWTYLDGERRSLAMTGFAVILVLAQLRYNAARPAGSIFESSGAVPFFLVLIPFLLGLSGASILRTARQRPTLTAWRLGGLMWIAALIGLAVKFMGYYDFQNAYAFDLSALFDAPIRCLVALTHLYYDLVPRSIADEQNAANIDNWDTALTVVGGLAVWLGALVTLARLPVRTAPLTLRDVVARWQQIDLSIDQKRYILAFVLLLPAVGLRTFTTFYPFLQTIALSVQRYNPAFPPRRYIDLRNFEKLSTDLVVRESLEFTLLFVFVSTFFQMALGLAIAHLLNANFRLRGVARTISLIPWAIPMVVAAIGFRWMFDDQFGMIPDLLQRLFGYEGKWLVDPNNARLAVTFVNVWKSTPFAALLLLAGLQGINEDLYEAARVDGANWISALRFITVPMLLPIIVTISMFLLVWQLAAFDLPFAMTGGAPGFSTTVVAQKIYLEINSLNYSFAAAVSIFLVFVVTLIGGAGLYLLRRVEVQA
jgi:multiple sugar transport system permease protein